MGLFDFLKKGEEKPVQQKPVTPPAPPKPANTVPAGGTTTAATPPVAQPAPAQPEFYTVKGGDSLSKIAKQLYGDANQWNRIFEANKDQIKNPDLIQPGWKLKIPR